jgi:hypothetical protein
VGQHLAPDERLDAPVFEQGDLLGIAQLTVWLVFHYAGLAVHRSVEEAAAALVSPPQATPANVSPGASRIAAVWCLPQAPQPIKPKRSVHLRVMSERASGGNTTAGRRRLSIQRGP